MPAAAACAITWRSDGMAGNFQSQFLVYDRAGEPCQRCGATIREIRQGQRSTFYCPAVSAADGRESVTDDA